MFITHFRSVRAIDCQKDVRIIAVCEVEGTRREKAKEAVEKHYAEDIKSDTYKGWTAYVD